MRLLRQCRKPGGILQKVAGGDLTAHVQGNYQGDHARIKDDINVMADKLSENMGQISQNAKNMASSRSSPPSASRWRPTPRRPPAQANVVSAAGAGEQERADRGHRHRGDERQHQGDRQATPPRRPRWPLSAVTAAETTNATVAKLGESQRRDRQGHQGHHLHRAADQPAGAQRHHRGRPRRRGRQGLRRRRQRGQGAGQGDRQGHRGHQPEDRGHPGRHQERGEAIAQIISIINQINDISNTIASAVEEQTATTNEISRNVAEAAKGSTQIAQNITSVATAAKSTTYGANNTQKASVELSRMAAELQRLVARFKFEGSGAGAAEVRSTSKQVRDAHLASRAKPQTGVSTRLQ